MTLEDLLQDHVRGCYITTIKPTFYDGYMTELEFSLHSGRKFQVQCFGLHGGDAGLEIVFEEEKITE